MVIYWQTHQDDCGALPLLAQVLWQLRQSKYSTPALINREYAKFHRFVIKGKFSKKAYGLGDDTLDCVTFFL